MSYRIDFEDNSHGCAVRVRGPLVAARAIAIEAAKRHGHAYVWDGSVLVARFVLTGSVLWCDATQTQNARTPA